MNNAAIILQMLITAGEQISKWSAIVAQAQAEGRDVSEAELDQASADYKTAHAQLDALLAGK